MGRSGAGERTGDDERRGSDGRTVAVVGAGLSGLTAARRLTQAGWKATVFEATSAVGGRVQTHREGGYQLDIGASAFSGAYQPYIELVDELGIDYAPVSPFVTIPRDGRQHILSMDRMVTSGLKTKLLPLSAKLRLARLGLDVVNAKRRGQLDYSDMRKAARIDTETVRDYARRRLTDEIDAYLCEPIVRTMLIADTDKVSKVELFSGIANIFAAGILAIVGGQGRVCEQIAAQLDVRLDAPVERVARAGDRVEVTHGGATEHYDAAVVTAPLPIAAAMCPDHAHLLAPLSDSLKYTQCLKVAIGFTKRPETPAFLTMLSSREDREIALIFLDHNKVDDRAPAGHALFDACWETDASTRLIDAPDDQIVERTLQTILRLHPELDGAVDFTHVTRWRHALPHTALGAYRKIGELNAALDPRDPIQFAADYLSAAGQNTAVALGNRAADNLQRTPALSPAGSAG